MLVFCWLVAAIRQRVAQPLTQRRDRLGVAAWRVWPVLDVPAQVLRWCIAIAGREKDVQVRCHLAIEERVDLFGASADFEGAAEPGDEQPDRLASAGVRSAKSGACRLVISTRCPR